MAKPTLSELQQLPDPAQSDHYELVFPPLPAGDGAPLRVQCQQVALPAKNIEPVNQDSAGNQLMHAGRATFAHDMNITFIESRTYAVHKAIRKWMDFVRKHDTQLGNYKSEYSRTVVLNVFDQKGTLVETFEIFGVWPSTLPEIQYDGTASNVITIAATFQIDYWTARN